jgi:hypothetical protein
MATTPKGYPYPVGTDRVTAVETLSGVATAGNATLPAPTAVNTPTTLAITFPVGRFTAVPWVIGSPQGGSPQAFAPVSTAAATAAGCTLYCARVSGSMATIVVSWLAIQI